MIQAKIEDKKLIDHLARMKPDGISIFTLEHDSIRGAIVSGTAMVNQMRVNHGFGPLETLVLGHAYLAASLLSVTIKGEDRISIRAEGSGPARGYSVECTARGEVRGRLFGGPLGIADAQGKLDTAPLMGTGSLSLTRFMQGHTEPVTGTAAMRSGRLAEDLAWYYHTSEQTRTSFSLGIHFDAEGRVLGAGGMFLQALPGAVDEELERMERLVYSMPPLGETFSDGSARMDVMLRMFPFFDLNMMDERKTDFFCGCTKERLAAYLSSMEKAELDDMAKNGPFPVNITCHNCGSVYAYGQGELAAMAARKDQGL